MIYTPLTKLAMKIAYEAHHGQLDKSGIPYIYHPIHLAEQMTDEKSTCVALLHDVVEDTDVTLEKLAEYGFDDEIIDAIDRLTFYKTRVYAIREQYMYEEDKYFDYIRYVRVNPLAAKVKEADLIHNSDQTRLGVVDRRASDRWVKYKFALEILRTPPEYFLFENKYIVKRDAPNWYKWLSDEKTWIYQQDWFRCYYDAAYDVIEIDFNELTEVYLQKLNKDLLK